MYSVLSYVGILLIVASIVLSMFAGHFAIFVFPIMLALGCIALGVAKIIKLLQEIKDRDTN